MGRRLKSRFEVHDREINGYLALSAPIFLTLLVVLPWAMDVIEAPIWLERIASIGYIVLLGLGYFAWYHWLSVRIGKKHRLLCGNCGAVLRRPFSQTDNPDHRRDGEVPKRCPRCHVDIHAATRASQPAKKAVDPGRR